MELPINRPKSKIAKTNPNGNDPASRSVSKSTSQPAAKGIRRPGNAL
jgi:hypothetical protein